MIRKRYMKEIRGTVFLDSNKSRTVDDPVEGLKDAVVNLFGVTGIDTCGDGVTIYKERLLLKTKTDETGRFSFLVNEGMYSINLDVGTLPSGKGVIEPDRFIDTGKRGSNDFAVRDIDIIESFTGAGNIKVQHPVNIIVPELSSAGKIDLAYRSGMIDERTKILHSLYSLFDRRKLPEEYRSHIPVKSGTRMVEEIRRYIEREDADISIVKAAGRFLSSPVPALNKTYKSPGGFFNIHYTTIGENAVSIRFGRLDSVPPYIKSIGEAFDNVKAVTCDTRGFAAPIPETGKTAMDIYVFNLKGKYGMTYDSKYYKNKFNVRTASGFICIDNNYAASKGFDKSRDDCMKVTAAHEFFHAVQYAYNVDSDSWWKEASATWNEDEVYTGVNDYIRYIGSYFSSPQKSLEESSYAGVVFAKYLSENFDGYGVIKRIWETQSMGYNNSVSAIDTAIRDGYAGEDIGTVYNKFSACNFNPAQYYLEGDLWKTPVSIQNTYSGYPVSETRSELNHLASHYQVFKPVSAASGKTLRIIVEGMDGAKWGFKLQKRKRSENACSLTEIASGGTNNRAEITVSNLNETYDEICLISSNLEKSYDGLPYTFSATLS